MAEGQEPTKVTTESSQAVLKAVAGRLAKIEAGEMPTITYVGADGHTESTISHTGEVAAVPTSVAPAPAASGAPMPPSMADMAHGAPEAPRPRTDDGWKPTTALAPPARPGFFARLFAKFRRADD